jgi:hypothetical protein
MTSEEARKSIERSLASTRLALKLTIFFAVVTVVGQLFLLFVKLSS